MVSLPPERITGKYRYEDDSTPQSDDDSADDVGYGLEFRVENPSVEEENAKL